jgi:hypothetical protein
MRRHLLALILIVAGIALGLWWSRSHRATPSGPPPQPVRIEDKKTIDFSSGKPVVRDSHEDQAVIDKAVKEMDAATKDITFGPNSALAPSPPKKPADPSEPAKPKP